MISNNSINKEVNMVIKDKKMIRKIFDRVYGVACYGNYFDDQESNMGIPYELEAGGEISRLYDQINNIEHKMAEEYMGSPCEIEDYADLWHLDCFYESLMKEFRYKMFLYGFTLRPDNFSDR